MTLLSPIVPREQISSQREARVLQRADYRENDAPLPPSSPHGAGIRKPGADLLSYKPWSPLPSPLDYFFFFTQIIVRNLRKLYLSCSFGPTSPRNE